MNRNTRTNQHRTFARLAAAVGAGVVTLGIAAPAFAETPEEPADVLDIVDAPECFDWTYDSLDWNFVENGNNTLMFQIGYLDGVNTCDAEFDLKIYTLASPTAAKDDPGSSLYFYGGYPVSVIEDETEKSGLHDWTFSEPGECSELEFLIDGVIIASERITDDCGDLPITQPEPQPEPENPDDFTSNVPTDDPTDEPGDFTSNVPTDDPGDEPGNGGEGGELPSTGVGSTAVAVLAAALTGLGGLALFGARRRTVVA